MIDSFETIDKDMLKLGGVASFLTEFGVCSFNSENSSNPKQLNTEECNVILENCDKFFTSWTYWDSNFYYSDNFQINYQLINVFSRVYPRFTNGVPVNLKFNSKSGQFIYSFQMNLNRPDLATEIFIPAHVYPNGFKIGLSSDLAWSFDSTEKTLFINLRTHISKIKNNIFFVMITRESK